MPIGVLVLYVDNFGLVSPVDRERIVFEIEEKQREHIYKKQIEEEKERRKRLRQERLMTEPPETAEYSKVFNTILHTPNITRIKASTKGNMFGRHKSDRFSRR
jgi:hypothetical protein